MQTIEVNLTLPATSFGPRNSKWASIQDLVDALLSIPEAERRQSLAMRADADDGEIPITKIYVGQYYRPADPNIILLE